MRLAAAHGFLFAPLGACENASPSASSLHDQLVTEQGAPAGWYPDTVDPAQLRWWDGDRWTAHTAPSPEYAASRVAEAGGSTAAVPYLASWGSRVGAALIDSLIIAVPVLTVSFGIGFSYGIANPNSDIDTGVSLLIQLIAIGIGISFLLGYCALMARTGKRNGQTWGKQVVGIRVINEDGRPITFGRAALREVLVKYLLGQMLCLLFTIVDCLWPLWDEKNQAVHDKIVTTLVVQDPPAVSHVPSQPFAAGQGPEAP